MRTSETIGIKGAVVVTAKALDEANRALEQIATSLGIEPVPTPKYSGSLSDGTRVSFDSFAELAGYPNRASRRLTLLRITLHSEAEQGKQKLFELDAVIGGNTPCTIGIESEQRHSLHARELMQDIIERIRAGYGWMWHLTGLSVLILFAALVAAPIVAMEGYFGDKDYARRVAHAAEMVKINPTAPATVEAVKAAREPAWNHVIWGVDYWMILVGVAVIALMFLIIRSVLWPRVLFEVGHEVERSSVRKERRKWFVVSVLLAVPLALLTRYLGSRVGL